MEDGRVIGGSCWELAFVGRGVVVQRKRESVAVLLRAGPLLLLIYDD